MAIIIFIYIIVITVGIALIVKIFSALSAHTEAMRVIAESKKTDEEKRAQAAEMAEREKVAQKERLEMQENFDKIATNKTWT